MTHLPRPQAPAPNAAAQLTDPPVASSATALFFKLIYGSISGWIELSAIEGDPDDREHCRFHQDWFPYNPQQLSTLLARVDELGQRYGNVYVSANVYRRPRRDAEIKPGRVVFVDDLPDGTEASFTVRTSPDRQQGYFLLDTDAPIEVRHDLARRAAAALGGDKSGADDQQIVRVPGTYNTKARAGGRHLVTLHLGTRRRYHPQELRATWPEVAAPSSGAPGTLDWGQAEQWLGNLGALIGANGLPRRVKPNTQTGRILMGVEGAPSTSEARYFVARGLMMHGYPDEEIAALLWHFCDYGKATEKGSAWVHADIARCIAKERAKLPGVTPSPTRAAPSQPAAPIAEVIRPKVGRKSALTPAQLLAFYEQEMGASDVVLLTVGEVATRLNISRATVERCERALRTQGAIERRFFARRQSSLVAVVRPVKIAEARPACGVDHVPSDETPVLIGAPQIAPTDAHEETHPPEGALALAPAADAALLAELGKTAGDLVYEAIVAIDTQRPIEVLNRKTGELRTVKLRVNRKRVERYLEQVYPRLAIEPAALEALYPEQLERRVRERKISALVELTPAGLRAQIRLAEHMADKSQALETNEWHWWAFYRDMARKELASRPPDPTRPKGGRKNCEALPNLREAGRRHQATLWAIADEALLELRGRRQGQRPSTGVCSSQPTPPAPPASDGTHDHLVAALKARKVGTV